MTWRRRLKEVSLSFVVLSLVGAVVGFAWMTRQPRHPFFQFLVELPVAGLFVEELRRPQLAAERREERAARGAADPERGPSRARDFEWIGIGAQLYQERSQRTGVLVTNQLRNYEVLQRQGSWLQIALLDGRKLWVDRSQARETAPPLGEEPRPPGPLISRSVDPQQLAFALSHFQGEARSLTVAGYSTWTDLPDSLAAQELLDQLEAALGSIDNDYRSLYGLEVRGAPQETLVLYVQPRSYRTLRSATEGLSNTETSGHTAGGLVALAVGERAAWEVEATLVHEITHLLNRRALGPALPPWLSEGLSSHLADLGRSVAPELASKYRRVNETQVLYSGPLASLVVLGESAEQGRLLGLATLTTLEMLDFTASGTGAVLYAQSAFWMDQLLEDPQQRTSFQMFLSAVAAGEPATGEALREHLGLSWEALDRRFSDWLGIRLARALTDLS